MGRFLRRVFISFTTMVVGHILGAVFLAVCGVTLTGFLLRWGEARGPQDVIATVLWVVFAALFVVCFLRERRPPRVLTYYDSSPAARDRAIRVHLQGMRLDGVNSELRELRDKRQQARSAANRRPFTAAQIVWMEKVSGSAGQHSPSLARAHGLLVEARLRQEQARRARGARPNDLSQ